MSNYISNENQRLLWKMANQIPGFAQLDPPKKDFEFKNVVEYFYNKLGNRSQLSTFELQQLNRETLSVFLPKPNPNPTPPLPSQYTNVPSVVPSVVPYQIVESREDKSMREFKERQNIYETMNKKPDLPNADEMFREKNTEEEKIQNMDELIMNYQKQREVDFNAISPPNILPNSVPSTKVNKLKLLDETILTENDVDDLDRPTKKSVSWNQSLIETMDSPKSLRILSLENKIIDLENKMEKIMNHFEKYGKEKKMPLSFPKHILKEQTISNTVNSILNETIFKIEKIDNIKNKMKLFT